MNNEHIYARHSSLHLNGSEFPFPQLNDQMNLENEELAFTSYHSSAQNVANNNPGFYRPYDTVTSNNNEDWSFVNNGGVFGANAAIGNRNVFLNVAPPDFVPETPPAWPHYPETTYSHYSSNLGTNINFWPQLYLQQQVNYESHVYDYRYSHPPETAVEDSNGSVYELDIERSSVDSPSISTSTPQPSTYPNDFLPFPVQQNYLHSFPATSMSNDIQPQFPIRPIPQQAVKFDTSHQCPACFRFCASAGGLKRHAKFCRVSIDNLENIFTSLKRSDESESIPENLFPVEAHPVNLSSGANVVTTNQPVPDVMPMNFSTNDLLPNATVSASTNKNKDGNQSPDIAETPDKVVPDVPTDPVIELKKSKLNTTESGNSRKRNCPECQLVLPSERALVEHLVTHNVDKPYSCVTCGSRFSRKFHLTRHVKQRGCDGTPRAEFPCEYCSKMFSRKDNLREHVKSHTGQSKPRTKLPCPIPTCDKEFQGRTQLQVHLNFHSGLRPYVCDRENCDKTFRSNAALKKHLRIHNSEKPFQCPQCEARFTIKESLARHMESHNILKPIKSFICNRCGMAFIQQIQLKKHTVKEHLPTETFRCTTCSRTYKRRWRLIHHYKTEHADKPKNTELPTTLVNQSVTAPSVPQNSTDDQTFECSECLKKFLTKNSLKSHYLTHVVEPPVACTVCSRVFIRRDCLLRHLRTKHRLPPEQALHVMENMSLDRKASLDQQLAQESLTDTSSCSTQTSCEPQGSVQTSNGDFIDISILEGNIIELLSLLVDPNALRNFGWPNSSVDIVLQSVLVKCGKEPFSNPNLTLAQRLRANTKMLFSFIVDDQTALENLFARRPVEHVLEQVIQLAKSGESSDNIVQLPL